MKKQEPNNRRDSNNRKIENKQKGNINKITKMSKGSWMKTELESCKKKGNAHLIFRIFQGISSSIKN